MGSYELTKHLVNGLDESPLRGSVAIGAGGAYRYCAWTTATAIDLYQRTNDV
jgi:methanogenic corrinoid protein MtbC1